jgi:hypothetical protein
VTWEAAYVAMSVAIDVPVDDAMTALDDAAKLRAKANANVRALSSKVKMDRAKALAAELLPIMRSIDELAIP